MKVLLTLLMMVGSIWFTSAQEADPLRARGRRIAIEHCSACHAVGQTGSSPRREAPAFRSLSERLELDELEDRMRGGLSSDHPAMPTFRFTRQQARELVAYLRSIQPQ